MKKYTKFDYLNILLIIISFLIVYIILLKNGQVMYGSTMDYANQHYLIPEYFRTLFYETKDLFPSLALNLGMGQNIYNFSYYGLFSPFIIISYLLPFVKMVTFLKLVSILVIIFDIVLFYHFILSKTNETKLRFIATFLFIMATPIILHSHRHIMFVNYMPFLLLGLICIDNLHKKNSYLVLIISILFIITTSYFFSIPSLIVLFIYIVFKYIENHKTINAKTFIKDHLKLSVLFIIPILISGVLLLPTLKAILNSRFGVGEGVELLEILLPNINLESFLYTSYSMGLTAIIIIAILNSVITKDKAYRFLGIIFTIIMLFPVVNYILNGFMYLNAKVFIPFIPLGILLIIKLIESVKTKQTNIKLLTIITVIVSILYAIKNINNLTYVYIIDAVMTMIGILILYRKNKIIPLIVILIITSFQTAIVTNLKDELAPKEVKEIQYNKEISQELNQIITQDDNIYRTIDMTGNLYSANNIKTINEYKTTMYSSLTNKYYKDFYWNTFDIENPNRNDAIFSDVSNPLSNIYLGNKYCITKEKPPVGYLPTTNKNIYQNSDVFTLGYASNNLISEENLKKLEYPYRLEAMLDNITIKNSKNINKEKDKTDLIEIKTNQKEKYNFIVKKDKIYHLKNPNKSKDYLTIISFNMNYSQSCKEGDTSVRIDNVTNTLTCKSWKYHNKNYTFTYVLSPSEKQYLDIEITKGTYKISDIKIHKLSYGTIKEISENHDKFMIDKNHTKGDKIVGNINVTKENSYFNLSIPYDEGYKIKVDKKEIKKEITNTSFIGFKIAKGYHEIEITYKSPWLTLGKIVSLTGLISLGGLLIIQKRSKKNEENFNDCAML